MANIYLSDKINMNEYCKNGRWIENEKSFYVEDDIFDEFLSINKNTREIYNVGFNGMLQEMISKGIAVIK